MAGKLADFSDQVDFISVHCMAHCLHLAVRRAYSSMDNIVRMEKILTQLHNFYKNPSHKRIGHLREMAASMDINLREINYIYEARWIASEYKAVKNIKTSWKVIVSDLKSISTDQHDFDAKTRTKASHLLDSLTEVHFIRNLHGMLDILNELNFFSLEFQKRYGLLVSQVKTIQQLEGVLLLMATDI